MEQLLLKNANISGRESAMPQRLLIREGLLADLSGTAIDGGCEEIDLDGAVVFPGFIDIHNHGAIGVDVNTATVDEMLAVGQFLAENGVSAWTPTFVPDSDENYKRQIGVFEEARKVQEGLAISQIVGVHYEGIFANEKMCGALRPEFFKKFSGSELDSLPKLNGGARMMTLAPEIDGGIELIRAMVADGWIASIGHTSADRYTLDSAFEAGARHFTHFFNAMTGIHHRDLGVAGWALAKEGATFDIIADGIHVADEMLKLCCRAKGADNVSLISDSMLAAGMGDGEYDVWGERIRVKDRKTQNERGSIAGSVIMLPDALRKMLRLGFSILEVAKMASSNPARLLGLDKGRGSIETGKRADLAAMDSRGNIVLSLIGGKIAFRSA